LIENLNGKIRKYTKNKMSFPTDQALEVTSLVFFSKRGGWQLEKTGFAHPIRLFETFLKIPTFDTFIFTKLVIH